MMGSQLDTSNDADLLHGNAATLANYLGISHSSVRRYQAGAPLPEITRKLLKLRLGDLGGVMGKEWQGFTIGHDHKLYSPFFRGGFSPVQICSMFFELQELAYLRAEVKRLNAKLEPQRAAKWARDKVRSLAQAPDN
jgi:hypothetical protein